MICSDGQARLGPRCPVVARSSVPPGQQVVRPPTLFNRRAEDKSVIPAPAPSAPDCSSSPGVRPGAPWRWVWPHPINSRLPKSATPVGATRDLAHWVGGNSVRVAKSLITTRPPLNSGSRRRPARCGTGTFLLGIHVCQSPLGPSPATVQQPSTGPLCHAVGTSDRPERPAQSGPAPYECAHTRRLSRPGSGASTPRTAGCHPSLVRSPWWRRLLP